GGAHLDAQAVIGAGGGTTGLAIPSRVAQMGTAVSWGSRRRFRARRGDELAGSAVGHRGRGGIRQCADREPRFSRAGGSRTAGNLARGGSRALTRFPRRRQSFATE